MATFAAKTGLTESQVRATASVGADLSRWPDRADRAVLDAADALCRVHDLTDDEWDELVSATSEEAAIDLLLICGWYHAISFVSRVPRLPRESGTPALPDVPRRG